MGTVFNGQAEDIQFKLEAGDGISITGDNANVISALRSAVSLEVTSPGLHFVPADTVTMPNGTRGCGMLLVMQGEVGGGSQGYIQYLVMYGAAFTRSYYQGWGDWVQIADRTIKTLSALASGGTISGKSLSTNDYTDSDKAKVAGAISETEAKAAFAAKGKLTDCHGFGNPGIYSIPYNAANLPDGVSFSSDRNATLLVTYSANTSWTNYEHSLTLILPDGKIYTQQCMAGNSFTAWTQAYAGKQDKAWQTLGSLTVAEGEEASSIKIAMPAALATCNELMLEVEFYVGSDKTSQWLPTFFLSDAGRVAYDCWLAGGGTANVTAGKKYYFVAHSRVGGDYVLTTFGQASEHIHGNSRAAAYTARTNTRYIENHKSYPCYLYCQITAENSFAAGTKIKLLGR